MTDLAKQDRWKIQNLLNTGLSLMKRDKSLHKSHTTISREIKKRRIVDEAGKKHRKNFCTLKNNCIKRTLCKAPYVCNGCFDMEKWKSQLNNFRIFQILRNIS